MSIESRRMYIRSYPVKRDPFQTDLSWNRHGVMKPWEPVLHRHATQLQNGGQMRPEIKSHASTAPNHPLQAVFGRHWPHVKCAVKSQSNVQLVDVVPFAAAFCWPSTAVISPRKTLLEAKAISRPARQSSQPVLRMAKAWRKRIPLLWDNTQTTCMDVLQGHKSKMISNCLEKKRKKLTSLAPFTVLYLQRMFHHRHHFVARNRVPTSFALPRSKVSSVSVGSWCLPSRGQRRAINSQLIYWRHESPIPFTSHNWRVCVVCIGGVGPPD